MPAVRPGAKDRHKKSEVSRILLDIRRHREVGLADRRHESLKVITLIETDSGYGPCDHSHYV